jgi:hypothetical protein
MVFCAVVLYVPGGGSAVIDHIALKIAINHGERERERQREREREKEREK